MYVLKRTPIKKRYPPFSEAKNSTAETTQTCTGKANPTSSKKRKPYKIPKVSEKLKGRLVEYKSLRLQYLKDNPVCEAGLEGCKKEATEIHHARGRSGELLNDTAYWVAICRNCHTWVTEHSMEAIELGLSISRHRK